jgi:hypothetical protein
MERSSDRRASGILSATVPAERELQEQCAATEDLLQQREREIVELNHRISNSLQLASSLLTLQRDRLDNIEARDALTPPSLASRRSGGCIDIFTRPEQSGT